MSDPRLATVQDLPSIISLFRAVFNDAYFDTLFPPTAAGTVYLETAFTSFLSDSTPGKLQVIYDDGGSVKAWVLYFEEGHVKYHPRWPLFSGEGLNGEKMTEFFAGMDRQHEAAMGSRDHIYLELIMTRPAYQKQGLASRLIRHVIDVAGDRPVYLDADDDAIGLYEKFGFRKAGEGVRSSEVMEPMIRPGGDSQQS